MESTKSSIIKLHEKIDEYKGSLNNKTSEYIDSNMFSVSRPFDTMPMQTSNSSISIMEVIFIAVTQCLRIFWFNRTNAKEQKASGKDD